MDDRKQEEEKQLKNGRRKKFGLSMFALITLAGIIAVFFYLRYKGTHISTDDAFIEGDIHTIASKVPGTVKAVYVKSNQFVKAGDILVELDAADYDLKVNEATSGLNAEKGKISEIDYRVEAAQKQLSAAITKADATRAFAELQQANFEQAQKDRDRAESLFKKEAISKERYERTMTAYKVALAQVKSASEDLKNALMGIEVQKTLIKQAQAAKNIQTSAVMQKESVVETAKLGSSYTKIYASVDGYVTKKSVEIGNQVQPGQPLMAVVSLEDIKVMANYKETQLEKVRPGQRAEIKVDTYPGKVFKGTVESIMAGTGSAFSLFPAENATGNFVKVVQRIPVRILLDKDADKDHVLRVGMSVQPTIVIEK